MKEEEKSIIPDEIISNKIYLIRNQKVMIDRDLADLYQVETKRLKEQVKRNLNRFPVFTEQGVAMLSSVLNSDRAIAVNIKIIRIFTKMRDLLSDNLSLRLEIEDIKKKVNNHDKNIELVFSYLDELIEKKENGTERNKIGYK